jgi:K+-sensing histidine kinase KdpD
MNWSYLIYLMLGLGFGFALSLFVMRLSSSNQKQKSLKYKEYEKEKEKEQEKLSEEIIHWQSAYLMAKEMSLFKGGFLARTTHELRSPLNGLINLHQLILSDLCENPEEEREFVTLAHERAMQLLKLLDEVLNIARVEHGTNQLDIQALQLAQVLKELYNFTHLLAKNRNYPYEVTLPKEDIYVLADPRWLRQVLLTGVETSISLMEEGSICISAEKAKDNDVVYIWLDIPCEGSGWSEAIDLIQSEPKPSKDRQLDSVPSPGMKLLLNQTLMELMNGKLEILSQSRIHEGIEPLLRLQLTIPLLVPDTEFHQEFQSSEEMGYVKP